MILPAINRLAVRLAIPSALLVAACSAEAPTESDPEKSLADQIERLRALGYVEGDEPARQDRGVTLHDPARAYQGLNLYTSEHVPTVFLVDMEGRLIREWQVEWPEPLEAGKQKTLVRRVKLLPESEILIVIEKKGMMRLDRDSRVLWHLVAPLHHDFDVAADGTIYALDAEAKLHPEFNPDQPILNNHVVIINADGSLRRRISLLEVFGRSEFRDAALGSRPAGDAFHTNTIEILDGRLADKIPAFKAGNLLMCWREQDAIGVMDVEQEKIVWYLQGMFVRPHQPTVLDNGNLLVFDNHDEARGSRASRVIQIDPISREVVWEFHSTPELPFWTRTGGSNSQLPNGNILISETRQGRALEVTPDGEVVWSFVNPGRVGVDGDKMARIYEMQRLPSD